MLLRLIVLLISLYTIAGNLSREEHEILRPRFMQRYYEHVDKCEFIITEKQPFDTCPGQRQECIVEMDTEDGKGYISIVRYGPYTSTGNYQETHCVGSGHVPKLGSWMIGGVLGAVDIYTNEYMEFPPIHNHHIIPQTKAFNPLIPPAVPQVMPWLSFAKQSFSTFPFPAGSADSQCLPEIGGVGCFYHAYPEGYGKRTYRANEESRYVFHLQDVRKAGSPPLSYYAEYAEHFITEMNPSRPLKPVVDVTMGIFGGTPPFTYPLKYNTAMFNFVTYYFPLRSQLVGNRMHWHPIAGDEAWVIRGTQDDLGIPKEYQRHSIVSTFETPVGNPIAVEDGDLVGLKVKMEDHLREANFVYAKHGTGRMMKEIEIQLNASTSSLRRRTSVLDDIPYVQLTDYSVSPRAPEILCKYLGQTEHITDEILEEKGKQERKRLQSNPDRRQLQQQWTGSNKPQLRAVSREEQAENKYTGSRHGHYYRASTSSMQRGDDHYPHCNHFEVEAGEFITVIHFIEPRTKPTDTEEFDSTVLTMMQHTQLLTHIHIPQLPFM